MAHVVQNGRDILREKRLKQKENNQIIKEEVKKVKEEKSQGLAISKFE
jgi:hypothetical protein